MGSIQDPTKGHVKLPAEFKGSRIIGAVGEGTNLKPIEDMKGRKSSSDEDADSSSDIAARVEGSESAWILIMCVRREQMKLLHLGKASSFHIHICFWRSAGGGLAESYANLLSVG